MDFYDVIKRRLSVRRYTTQPVPNEALNRILDAARLAPSACNRQPWQFLIVGDAAVRRSLFQPEKQDWAAVAPLAVVACSRPGEAWIRWADQKNHSDIDLAIAFEHIVLAAAAEGLGTCWICAFDPRHVRDVLKLPPEMEPVAMSPLGYPAVETEPRPRKELGSITTWI